MNRIVGLTIAAAAATVSIEPAQAVPLLSDSFTGAANTAPDSTRWASANPYGNGSSKQDGNGNLLVNVGTTGASIYQLTATKESNFDAFHGPLTISLRDISIGGVSGITTSATNGGWVLYGRSATNVVGEYRPNTGAMAFGVVVLVNATKNATTEALTYNLVLQEYSDNAAGGRALNSSLLLNGAPTGLTVTIDGASRMLDVSLDGTTLASSGQARVSQALTADFTEANLSTGGMLTSRISLGAVNSAATTSNSLFTVGSIEVAVPEPAALGLLGSAGLLLGVRRYRVA